MTLKFKLAKRIYENEKINSKDKLDFIRVIKEFDETEIKSLTEMPIDAALKSPAIRNRFKMIYQKLIKDGKSSKEAKAIANRMLGIK